MTRAIGIAIAVVFLVAFIAFAYTMNPGHVDFKLSPGMTHNMPLGLLMVATLVLGMLIAVIGVGIQQVNQKMSTWNERRKARQFAEILELNASGSALTWSGETERGRTVLKKAWRKDPHNKGAALALAASFSDTGEYESARQALEAAAAEEPADPDLRFALGNALFGAGEVEDAIRMHETLRVQYPHAPRVLMSLRDLYSHTGRWQEAATAQERYISELASSEGIHRERERLRDFRLQAAMQLEDSDAKISALEALLEEYRDFSPALEAIGNAMMEAGRTDEAVATWEKVFKREPDIDLAYKMLAQQTDSPGRHHVVALVTKNSDKLGEEAARVLRARAALDNGALDSAKQELEGVSSTSGGAGQKAWADFHQMSGDPDKAWETIRPLVG